MEYSAVGCIVTLTLSLLAAPLAADAQPSAKVARIGYLAMTAGAGSPAAEAFRQGLQDLGYVEGKTIAIAYRSAEGKPERLPALAAELVQLPVDVIVAQTNGAAQAAKNTTTTIPIVMVSAGDPVATGLVASLARPGGNLTGLSLMSAELGGKRLELLKEALPSLARVAVLWNTGSAPMTDIFREIQAAAPVLGVTVQPLGVHEAKEIDSALAALTENRPDALFMITDVLTGRHTRQVVDFAAQHQIPTMFEGRGPGAQGGPVAEGGLMSYGPSLMDMLRRAAYYVDRILKGAKPGEAYATMFGYDNVPELLGCPVVDRIAPHDRDRLERNAAALLRGESALTRHEYQGVKKDGTLLWIEALVAPVSFGGKTALQVTLQDITERKRAEEALTQAQAELERRVMERTAALHETNARLVQEIAERTRSEQALRASEERWRSLVEDAPDTILEVDQRGTIRLTNRGMPGLTRAATVGTRFVDHFPKDQRPVLQHAMDQARRTSVTQYCEIPVASPPGTVTWWSYRISTLNRADTGHGFLVVGTDITTLKATERALRQQDRLAAMGTLAAGIAHEINNPLGAIRLAVERARDTYTRPQDAEVTRECLDDIIANTQRCTRIIKSVLDFAQQELSDRWPADLNQIVRTAVDITRHYAEQRGACITLALAPALPVVLVNSDVHWRSQPPTAYHTRAGSLVIQNRERRRPWTQWS